MNAKNMKKAAALSLAGVLALGTCTGCGKAEEVKLDGSKTVATVAGHEVPMGLLSLAVRGQQANYEYIYSYYMSMGYLSSLWDQVTDEETGETFGDATVKDVLESLEKMYLMKDHAAEYEVEITEAEQADIAAAAAEFMSDNSEETLEVLAVTEDQVKEYLELMTYRVKVQDKIEASAEVEVTDEEAQQSTFTYVSIEKETEDAEEIEETEDDAEEAEEAEAAETEENAEETEAAETEETAEEAETEETAEETEEPGLAGEELANAVLEKMLADPAADMDAAAKEVSEDLSAHTASFDTNAAETEEDDIYSAYPTELLDALRNCKDGEVLAEVISTDSAYYVARLDQKVDAEKTESKKESLISEKQTEYFNDLIDQWLEEADKKVEDSVLAGLKLTDSHTFTLKTEEAEEIADEAEEVVDEAADEAEEVVEEVVDEAEEVVEEVVDEAEEVAEEVVDEAEEAAEEIVEETEEKAAE